MKIKILLILPLLIPLLQTGYAQTDTSETRLRVDQLNAASDSVVHSNTAVALEYAREAVALSKPINYLYGLADAYYNVGEVFYYQYDKDSALYYYRLSADIANVINYETRKAHCEYSIAHIYYETDQYDLALEYAGKARSKYEKLLSKKDLAKTLNLICEVYNYKGLSEKAIDVCVECIKVFEELNNKSGKANVLNVIGNIYIQLKIYEKAERHLFEALQLSREAGSKFNEATTNSTLGEMYFDQEKYDQALRYFGRAHEIDTAIADTLGIGYSSFFLGKTYVKLDSLDKAMPLLQTSLRLSWVLQDKDLRAHANALLGEAYSKLNRHTLAMRYHQRSLALAQEINAYPILTFVHKSIADYYERLGDAREALKHFKLYMQYEQRLKREENARKIAEVDAIYDIAQKEKQIELLTKENQIQALVTRQRELTNKGLLGGIFFFLILAGVLFSRNRLKNKANKALERQKEAINKQKEEIEQQRDDIQRKSTALSEFNKQITDSIEYAKLIQLSLLPAANELKLIFPDSFVFNKPRDIISGDFYWLSQQEDQIYLAVIDCTGHGVPGAFMTVLASSLLNQVVVESRISSPSMILTLLDIKIKQNLHQREDNFLSSDGMDIGLCAIDKSTCTVTFAGARFPFYISDGKSVEQINGDRYPVGSALYPNKQFNNKVIKLKPGTCIYLATDGFQDQFGGARDTKFMKSNFRKLLCKIAGMPVHEQYNFLTDTFYKWKGDSPQTDDILAIGIRI